MLFNSLEYFLFLPIVFFLYWALQKSKASQNFLILVASYIFYAYWDWRFLSLIIISSFVDFIVGIQVEKTKSLSSKKILVAISLFVNLGFLFVFKYYNFFVESFVDMFANMGMELNPRTLSVIIPVGISFYTFQTLSYTLDIYYERMKPTHNIVDFFAYVSFFPQLVAGPIERASNLLPQFEITRKFTFDKGRDGMRQILWGLFKKVVIADNCAIVVDAIYADQGVLGGPILFLGAILFVVQVYCDFAGYSDIAIGSARLLGFNLMQNFNNPYFATNSTEFWRRWHISMSTWFRDYVFNPIVMSLRKYKSKAVYISTLLTFTLIGIWHGANWTYIIFGFLQSLALTLEIYNRKWRKKFKKRITGLSAKMYDLGSWFLLMSFWTYLCIIFRSDTFANSNSYVKNMFSRPSEEFLPTLQSLGVSTNLLLLILAVASVLFIVEWINRKYQHGLERLPSNPILRYSVYIVLYFFVIQYLYGEKSFIYFQF